jgi:hypothetical protein
MARAGRNPHLKLDEKALLDMGVTRLEVISALSLRLWKDPSQVLSRAWACRLGSRRKKSTQAGRLCR